MTLVDARGLLCPWPLMLTKQALAESADSGVVETLADDPMAELDLRALCAREGHELVSLRSEEGAITARIKKAATQAAD